MPDRPALLLSVFKTFWAIPLGIVPASSNSAHADSPADHMSGYWGHMRAKLLNKGSEALSELKLLKILLYADNRRGEIKPLAKALMRRFGSPSAVLRAPATLLA